jgi:hypothetical protein
VAEKSVATSATGETSEHPSWGLPLAGESIKRHIASQEKYTSLRSLGHFLQQKAARRQQQQKTSHITYVHFFFLCTCMSNVRFRRCLCQGRRGPGI